MDRLAEIETRIRNAFTPTHLAVVDDSPLHAGHAGHRGAGEVSHLSVTVVADAFAGKTAVERQRMVYALFSEDLASGVIHAMALTTKTPAEWEKRAGR